MIIGARRRGIVTTTASLIGVAILGIAACRTPAPTPPPADTAGIGRFGGVGSDPLIFVDGERVEGSQLQVLARYRPDDIESIEIIKGAAAMDRYGVEAANGVIVIVLK
jgi:TonB-dependent SusC/RagA subfamily outer membrane receptor